jgi:hypothetical protein
MSAVFAAGLLYAQDRGPGCQGWDRNPRGWGHNPGRNRRPDPRKSPPEPPELVTINGTLSLVSGRIALQKDQETYVILGLGRLIGFIDGLKEGAEVTLEGFVRTGRRDEKIRYLLVNKLGINGREYNDLAPAFPREGPGGTGHPPRRADTSPPGGTTTG